MTPERRRTPRTIASKLAYIHLEPDNGGIVLNVSDEGIGFHAIGPVEPDKEVRFWFSLKADHRIEAVAELAWIDETRKSGGLHLSSLNAEARAQIREWIEQSIVGVEDREEVIARSPGESEPGVLNFPQTAAGPAGSEAGLEAGSWPDSADHTTAPDESTLQSDVSEAGQAAFSAGEQAALSAAQRPATSMTEHPHFETAAVSPPVFISNPVKDQSSAAVASHAAASPARRPTAVTMVGTRPRIVQARPGNVSTAAAGKRPATVASRPAKRRYTMSYAAWLVIFLACAAVFLATVYRREVGNTLISWGQRFAGSPAGSPLQSQGLIVPGTPTLPDAAANLTDGPSSNASAELSQEIGKLNRAYGESGAKPDPKFDAADGLAPNPVRRPLARRTPEPAKAVSESDTAADSSRAAPAGPATPATKPATDAESESREREMSPAAPNKTAAPPPELNREPTAGAASSYFDVGDFKEQQWAVKATQELSELGFRTLIIHKKRLWANSFHVLVGPFGDNARAAYETLKEHGFTPHSATVDPTKTHDSFRFSGGYSADH